MLFTNISFLYYFLPVLIIIYFIMPKKFKNIILFLASMIFYFYGEPKYILLMILEILIAYIGGILIKKYKNKKILLGIIIIHIIYLFFFKYTDFIIGNINNIFKNYNTPQDFINMSLSQLEDLIHPCGFYKTKAKNIKAYSEKLLKEYNGTLPQDIDKLMKLPGIGRKSANVIMLEAFNSPVGIAVDTHVKRIATRLGLTANTDPSKIEQDLIKIIPPKYFKDVNHIFIWHGRNICLARNPKCDICPLAKYCFSVDKV